MRRIFANTLKALAVVALSATVVGCEGDTEQKTYGNWYQTYSYFPGVPRGGAVCFQMEVGDTLCAFIGTGANTNKTEEQERFRDFYMVSLNSEGSPSWTARYEKLYSETDTAKAATTQKYYKENVPYNVAVASMPREAAARNGAVGFSINGKGYVGLGYDGENYLNDFWCYDPKTNSWEKAPTYPGDAVRYATCFVIDNVAYVGCGEDYDNNILGDFYKFDGTTWTAVQSIGVPRTRATSFVCHVDGKAYGYVFGGSNGGATQSFQRYDAETNTWQTLRNTKDQSYDTFDDAYTTLARYGASAFVVDDGTDNCRAYVTMGTTLSGNSTATWEYNPKYDYWMPRGDFEGSFRIFSVTFTLRGDLDGRGEREIPYITTGASNDMTVTGSGGTFYNETWAYEPMAFRETRD